MVLKLFNLDLHISVIEDVKNIFYQLYGDSIEITNWSISGHNWVFGKTSREVKFINQGSWHKICPQMVEDFVECYRDFLSTFDGFIVTHTPVFALLYESFNKPILMVNSCRYDQPYCWFFNQDNWTWLSSSLRRLWTNGLLIPISNNKADQRYLELGASIKSQWIPSLCLYTNTQWLPTRAEFVCFGDRSLFPPSELLVERPREGYSWKDLYSYKGIVHIPYEMSTMSQFEQYSAGVPLFFPSKDYYRKSILDKRYPFGSIYFRGIAPALLAEAVRSLDFWLDRADFYDNENFKYVHFYESPEDLIQKITNFNETDRELAERRQWLNSRKEAALEAWKAIIDAQWTGLRPLYKYY